MSEKILGVPAGAAPIASNAQILLQLADRCEREEPSAALDVDIYNAAEPAKSRQDAAGWEDYTSSIDAAVTLVPEGWCISSLSSTCCGHWRAELYHCGNHATKLAAAQQDRFQPHIKSGPLALCAAALRARAAVAGVEGDKPLRSEAKSLPDPPEDEGRDESRRR